MLKNGAHVACAPCSIPGALFAQFDLTKHTCVRIPPKLAVSDVMGYVKGKGAMVLRDRHPEWGKVVGRDKTFWARGHCVGTVGLNEETVRRYVAEREDGSRFE